MGKIQLGAIYRISDDVVARDIEEEFFIIPVAAGIGDSTDDMYTLNDTGRAIWDLIDGARTVEQIISQLAAEFSGPDRDIREDVTGLMEELLTRGILEKV